jgi:hypothetical protein
MKLIVLMIAFFVLSFGCNAQSNSSLNLDGYYQRRGSDGECCYKKIYLDSQKETGFALPNADLEISGAGGTYQVMNEFIDQKKYQRLHLCKISDCD